MNELLGVVAKADIKRLKDLLKLPCFVSAVNSAGSKGTLTT